MNDEILNALKRKSTTDILFLPFMIQTLVGDSQNIASVALIHSKKLKTQEYTFVSRYE